MAQQAPPLAYKRTLSIIIRVCGILWSRDAVQTCPIRDLVSLRGGEVMAVVLMVGQEWFKSCFFIMILLLLFFFPWKTTTAVDFVMFTVIYQLKHVVIAHIAIKGLHLIQHDVASLLCEI